MKIVSYNVNGIRAAISKGLISWLGEADIDVLCLQETKAQPDQIDTKAFEELGYNCYYTCAEKKGYSGVAIFTKVKPDNVIYGMGNAKYDCEGRVIRADYGDFTLICVYIPSGTSGEERQAFKMEFLADFKVFIDELRKERPNILVCGDYNIAHTPIDINHPERQKGVSGFLPEERDWVTEFLESGMIDTFRVFDDRAEQYSWWSYRFNSRSRNAGWRIDYHMASEPLRDKLVKAEIWQHVVHSDHCPIFVQLQC